MDKQAHIVRPSSVVVRPVAALLYQINGISVSKMRTIQYVKLRITDLNLYCQPLII